MTGTREPGTTSARSSAITIRQFDAASAPIRCEPGTAHRRHAVGPVLLAVQQAPPEHPRARDAGDAVERHGGNGRALDAALAQQLADRRPHEHLERHQRADRVAGQAEDRRLVRAEVAEALRLARLHGHLDELDRAQFAQGLLDHVVRAHAHAAAGDDDVRAQQLRLEHVHQLGVVVGDDADPVGLGAGVAGGGGEQVGVGVTDLAEAGRLADLDQLVAGGDDDHARTGVDEDAVAADRGQQPDLLRTEGGALPQRHLAGGHVLAGPAHGGSGLGGDADPDPGDAAVGVLDADHRVGSGRHRRAGHDPHGQSRAHPRHRAGAGDDVTDHRQHDRAVFAGGADVDRAHRVPVDGGVVETRQRSGRADVLGQGQALRVEDGQLDRVDGVDARQHLGQVVVQAAPGVDRAGCGPGRGRGVTACRNRTALRRRSATPSGVAGPAVRPRPPRVAIRHSRVVLDRPAGPARRARRGRARRDRRTGRRGRPGFSGGGDGRPSSSVTAGMISVTSS